MNHVNIVVYLSSALEIARNLVRANIEKQAEGDRNVEIEAQNVSFKGSAEADCSFKINEALNERAARGHWWLPQSRIEQAIQHIGTYP